MAKITTIIDIGSNSMRMVVFQKSSHFAFHLLNETKSKVKISQGCYENGGYLQKEPLQRAYDSLKSFLNISKSLKSRKIICVATSALRDAPNSKEFLNQVKNGLGLKIKVIDGEKEAFYGGVAALNLVCEDNFFTIDIGGGSTEFCFIKDKKIIKSISLNVGTVRIRELFLNKGDFKSASEYILKEFEQIKNLDFEIPETCVGIGGTIRALSKIVMQNSNHPLDVIHEYSYDFGEQRELFSNIFNAKTNAELSVLRVKSDRFDTICEGTFIFDLLLSKLNTKKVVTSGAGVREGIYLSDLLRTSNYKFPSNFNLSMRSLLDRFEICPKQSAYYGNNVKKIFDVLSPLHELKDEYKRALVIASKLSSIGGVLNFYKTNESGFEFILNGLGYSFSHSNRAIVANLIKFSKNKLILQKDFNKYKELLPKFEDMQWLSFMMSLNVCLNQDYSRTNYSYSLEGNILTVFAQDISYLVLSSYKKIELPISLELRLVSNNNGNNAL